MLNSALLKLEKIDYSNFNFTYRTDTYCVNPPARAKEFNAPYSVLSWELSISTPYEAVKGPATIIPMGEEINDQQVVQLADILLACGTEDVASALHASERIAAPTGVHINSTVRQAFILAYCTVESFRDALRLTSEAQLAGDTLCSVVVSAITRASNRPIVEATSTPSTPPALITDTNADGQCGDVGSQCSDDRDAASSESQPVAKVSIAPPANLPQSEWTRLDVVKSRVPPFVPGSARDIAFSFHRAIRSTLKYHGAKHHPPPLTEDQWQEVLLLLQLLEEYKVSPMEATYNILLDRSRTSDDVAYLLKHMLMHTVALNSRLARAAAKSTARNGDAHTSRYLSNIASELEKEEKNAAASAPPIDTVLPRKQ